jgi:hypothetical protein
VEGPSGPVGTLRPAWSWESAGGGNGTFRFRLNSDNLATGAMVGQDTSYTPSENLAGGIHTLYVQERDAAGNWSQTGSYSVRIDTTPPSAPSVEATPASPTNNRRPTWKWAGISSEGTAVYRYKLNNNDLRAGLHLRLQPPSHPPETYLRAPIHSTCSMRTQPEIGRNQVASPYGST